MPSARAPVDAYLLYRRIAPLFGCPYVWFSKPGYSARSVCSRTCLTRTVPSPCRSSSRWAPSGAHPAAVRKARRTSSVAVQPHERGAEPVRAQRVGAGLDEPGAVPVPGRGRVDGELGDLAVRDRVDVGVGGRAGDREAADRVALQGDQHPVAGVLRAGQGRRPRGGELLGVEGVEHLGGQQAGVLLPPGADLHGRDAGGVVGPAHPDRDVGGGSVCVSRVRTHAASVPGGGRCDRSPAEVRSECHIGLVGWRACTATTSSRRTSRVRPPRPLRLRSPSSPGWRSSGGSSARTAGSSRAT